LPEVATENVKYINRPSLLDDLDPPLMEAGLMKEFFYFVSVTGAGPKRPIPIIVTGPGTRPGTYMAGLAVRGLIGGTWLSRTCPMNLSTLLNHIVHLLPATNNSYRFLNCSTFLVIISPKEAI